MAKPTIVTRAGKGSALTWTEGDSNLTNLQDATITLKAGSGGTDVVSDLNGTVTLVAGTNVTLSGDNTAKTVTINSTASGGGGVTISDDTTTNATRYLVFEDATSGTVSTVNVASTKLTFNPSTGTLSTTILSGATLNAYKETVYSGGNQASAYTPNWNNGTVQTVTLTGNVTFAAPTNMVAGSSLTLILTQDATGGRTGNWNASYKFSGGTPSLSTAASAIDVVNIFYDGTNYLAGISKQDSTTSINNLQLNATGELRLADGDSSNYVGFKSPATVSTNKIWTLPNADGTSGQILSTDGAGALSWASASNNIIVISSANAAGIVFPATANTATSTTLLLRSAGGTGATVSTNTFTLPAGTYQIMFPFSTSANASKGDWHIYNSTDATTLVTFNYDSFTLGGLSVAMYGSPTYNFTIAASKTFTIRTTSAVTGGWTLQSGHWSAGYVFQIAKL